MWIDTSRSIFAWRTAKGLQSEESVSWSMFETSAYRLRSRTAIFLLLHSVLFVTNLTLNRTTITVENASYTGLSQF